MRLSILVAVLALLLPLGVSAQSVTFSGIVRDDVGHALPGTKVEVLRNNGGRPRLVTDSVLTDASGAFELVFDRVGLHLLRARTDSTDVGMATEVPLYVDRPETVEGDLVISPAEHASAGAALRIEYADPSSRAAQHARIFGYPGMESEENSEADPSTDSDFENALLIRSLMEALREQPPTLQEQAREALDRIPPGSPAWIATGDLYHLLHTMEATGNLEASRDYADRYIQEQPDPYSVTGLVYELLGQARLQGDSARLRQYLAFVREQVPNSFWGSRSLNEYGPDRAVQKGKVVPAFAFPKLRGDGVIVPEDLAGQVYLIDFWAVWCAPCIAERDELAELYQAHHEQGFEIISVSFDFDPEDVDLERWPMPWRHAYLAPGASETEAVKETFAVGAIPKLVLVGRDGRVIAGGAEVRPEVVGRLLPLVLD